MPKYVIAKPYGHADGGPKSPLRQSGEYVNSEVSAIITKLSICGYIKGRFRIFITLNSKKALEALLSQLSPSIRSLTDSESSEIANIYQMDINLPVSQQDGLTNIFLILDHLDPFDDQLKQEIERACGINFGFSNDELHQLIIDEGIASTMMRVKERSPWQAFSLTEIYREIFEKKEELSEDEVRSYLSCYDAIPESDPHYLAASQISHDFNMQLPLDQFSEETQLYLRKTLFKTSMRLGDFDLSSRLLPGLCGYPLGENPFPKITGTSQDALLSQLFVLASHIKELNHELKNTKAENVKSKSPELSKSSGFFDKPSPVEGHGSSQASQEKIQKG